MKTLTPPLILFILILALVSVGIISVYSASASPAALSKQCAFASAGLLLMSLFYLLPYQLLQRASLWILGTAMALCLMVYLPKIGSAGGRNAHRWIALGGFKFQPSEFAKLAMVIYMAKMLSGRRHYNKYFTRGVLPAMIITGVFAAIIVVEPDFGAAFTLSVAIFAMWVAAEMRWFHLLGLISAGIPAGVAAFVLEPYRVKRVLAFTQLLVTPEKVDPALKTEVLYQLYQSLIAVGSGGWNGLGLAHSLQRYHYSTEAHTDFIFAIMCEEWGFWKIAIILGLYAAMICVGWYIAWNIPDMFGSLLASGITLLYATSAVIHMCVIVGLLPTKGLVLPFFSAGGSSLLINMAAAGILMNIGRYQYTHQIQGPER